MFLLIDAQNAFPLNVKGEPLLFDAPVYPITTRASLPGGIVAARLSGAAASQLGEQVGDARSHACDPLVARAVGALGAKERMRFDPADGSALTWDEAGEAGRGASGVPVFPRIDPCVIGLVRSPRRDAILLGENARRPGYYTCVAGYVSVGEALEEAWRREVLEETGRRVDSCAYAGSQPWPHTGALMMAMVSTARQEEPSQPPDGELRSILWVERQDVAALPLARQGSIARRLIDAWVRGDLEGEQDQWQLM
mgnify:CR=1 FL=1